jgi:hypothetical protein
MVLWKPKIQNLLILLPIFIYSCQLIQPMFENLLYRMVSKLGLMQHVLTHWQLKTLQLTTSFNIQETAF